MVQTEASPFVEPWQATPRAKAVIAVVTVVIVVLSAATFVVQRIWLTPEAAVEGYFGALADRDVSKAASYIRDSGTATSDIVKAEQYVPPTKLKISAVEGDEQKTAKVSFFLGDQPMNAEIPLHRKKELTLGLFRGWAINGDRPSIQISTSAPVEIQVNGKPLPPEAQGSRVLQVFPGRYVVGVADNPLIESAPVTVNAAHGENEANLEPKIKADARSAVDVQVKEYLKGCVTKNVESCPFTSSISKQAWRIDTYPVLEVRLDESGAVRVDTTTRGKATVTGSGYGGYPTNDSMSFDLSGSVVVDQGKLKFQPE